MPETPDFDMAFTIDVAHKRDVRFYIEKQPM